MSDNTIAPRTQGILVKTTQPTPDEVPIGGGWYRKEVSTPPGQNPWDTAHQTVDKPWVNLSPNPFDETPAPNLYGAPSLKDFQANPFYWINHNAGGNI